MIQIIKRTLRRYKGYGVLNMVGLSVGIACAVLIFLWVEDELTYNHYFKNRDNLYKILWINSYAGVKQVNNTLPSEIVDVIMNEIHLTDITG